MVMLSPSVRPSRIRRVVPFSHDRAAGGAAQRVVAAHVQDAAGDRGHAAVGHGGVGRLLEVDVVAALLADAAGAADAVGVDHDVAAVAAQREQVAGGRVDAARQVQGVAGVADGRVGRQGDRTGERCCRRCRRGSPRPTGRAVAAERQGFGLL